MGLNKAQKEAVEYLEGPLLVLAGPGTGKTQLLSEKVAYILKNTDLNPDNILCLTFTDAAADNMRERLRGMIKDDALKVNIGTFHSFGREILAQYQEYSEDYDRVLEAAIDEVRQYKIIRQLIDDLPAYDILKTASVKDVQGVISAAKRADLSGEDLAKIAAVNQEDAEVLGQALAPLLAEIVPRKYQESHDRAYAPMYEVLQRALTTEPILGRIQRSVVGMAKDLGEALAEAEAVRRLGPLSDWKKKYFELDSEGRYRLSERIANKKLESLARVMTAYEKHLRDQGLYDFDDMIQEAVKVLKNDRGFQLTLEERYQYIMIDEFQDTNPSQFAIVKALTDYEKPLVMAVGDDDQAIYEFQGAMSSNLTDFQKYYDAKVVLLTENYRSTQEILDFSHKIIEQAEDRFGDKELVAHKPAIAGPQILRHEFQGAEAEYQFIAEQIARLIKAGVPQSEIAILSYKTRYFEPLLPFLKAQEGVQIAYERKDDLLEVPRIHQILTILGYVNALASEQKPTEQLMEILTYPFLGLKPVEAVKIASKARQARRSLYELMAEEKEFKGVAQWLAELAAMAMNEPLEVVVHAVVEKIDAEPMSDYERYVFYENVASLMGQVRQHFGEGQKLRVADLLEMIEDYKEANMKLAGLSPYRDAEDAVQVMTAHKAKGLEFRYVFVITADTNAWGKGEGNRITLVLPKNVEQIRHTGRTDSERLRLLYVAMTRAKDGIFITNARRDYNGRAPKRLEYLKEYEEGEEVMSPLVPEGKVRLAYDPGTVEQRRENMQNWLAVYRPELPEMREVYLENVRNWRMSASALTSFIDLHYGGPQEFFKSYVLRAPQGPEPESVAFGDVVHKTFEAITKTGLRDEEALGYFLEELDKKDLSALVAKKVRERGVQGLEKAVKEFGAILRTGEAEVQLWSENLVIGGVPVTGKIDHIIVDDEAKTLELYDFKTSNYHDKGWESVDSLYKYAMQLGFYKLLLNNSAKYGKYKIARAHILFVSPDRKDGKVHDKVYDFEAEKEEKLVRLMQAVYGMVKDLSFIEDEEIMVAPDESKGLRDMKEFVELLLSKAR